MTDDDLRSMLQRQAASVRVSDDAWDEIQARIAAADTPAGAVRRHPFRVVAGGAAAAAAVAAFVVAQVVPGPAGQVASSTSTSVTAAPDPVFVPPDFPYVFPDPTMSIPPTTDPLKAAERYLYARTSVKPAAGEIEQRGDDAAVVHFREGPVLSEVFLRRSGRGWWVESAGSDLVPLGDTAYDGLAITGGVGIEMAGTLELTYRGGDGEPKDAEDLRDVELHELVELDGSLPGEQFVVVRAVLRGLDDRIGVSETWVPNSDTGTVAPDPSGEGIDTYRGVWPAYTGEELAGYEDQAAAGERPDLEDPGAVAGQFLGEVFFPRDTSEVSYEYFEFQPGDALSGEVPFETSEGVRGVVAVRRASAEARTWYVVHAATEPAVFDIRTEGGGITVEPAAGTTVTLAEAQPMPGGDLVTGEPADQLLRFEGVTNAIVKLRGTDAEGRTVISFSRVADAG